MGKEIGFVDVTTTPSDLKEMAQMAAKYLKCGKKTQIITTTHLIWRNSQ